ncbi:MAG: hypothetical protein KDA86_25220 [Planctomycetaceae bacterium]|nr:hypothetical protein [Planctomycetaceae bacterium]
MTQITFDPSTIAQLGELTQPVEIVNDSGQVLGLFSPVMSPPYEDSWIPPMSQPEFETAVSDGPGLTTDELLLRLGEA